ncbi:hypothetical protein B0H17DRAFT_1128449 [Mycena rosella]|uniref:Uncharacterized protein n=1 Tax=Mycena rosella TaxID=1033263 RepID=A0AAD7GQW7_MYCRO|nr:hypothetical protein B0H17DRAFT_1128449 [Mycena rosella]
MGIWKRGHYGYYAHGRDRAHWHEDCVRLRSPSYSQSPSRSRSQVRGGNFSGPRPVAIAWYYRHLDGAIAFDTDVSQPTGCYRPMYGLEPTNTGAAHELNLDDAPPTSSPLQANDVPAHNHLTGACRKPLGSNSCPLVTVGHRGILFVARRQLSVLTYLIPMAVVLVQGEQKIGGFMTLMVYERVWSWEGWQGAKFSQEAPNHRHNYAVNRRNAGNAFIS